MDPSRLLHAARGAAEQAHAPYSGLAVGAAVLWEDGMLTTGCNVENASYGLTLCAERTAVVKGASEGARCIAAVAVHAAGSGAAIPPCGACLQVITEFTADPARVAVLLSRPGGHETCRLADFLPRPFRLQPE